MHDSWDSPRLVNPLEEPEWDRQVGTLDGSAFFHGAPWARVLHTSYGHHPLYLVVSEEGRFRAVQPLMELRSLLTGTRGVSLPFSDECQPVGFGIGSGPEVLDAILKIGRERGWRYWECRGGRALSGQAPPSLSHWGHTLDLRPGEAALLGRLRGAVRQAIRKAESGGLKWQRGTTLGAVEAYYRLHCRTRRKHGVPPQPWSFFVNIHEHVLAPGHGFVSLVTWDGQPIAGAVFFTSGRSALFKYGASDERCLELRGNNLQMWRAIQWLSLHGYEQLDFGRTAMDNPGLRRFKQAWGTTERRIDYFKYDFRTARFVQEKSSPWEAFRPMMRRMPSRLSRLAGMLLCRHLSSWSVVSETLEMGVVV